MKIDRTTGAVPAPPVSDSSARKADQRPARESATEPAATARPRDSVEISARGRELAQRDDIGAESLAAIQQRIADGHYDTAPVRTAVAQRLLGSGDL